MMTESDYRSNLRKAHDHCQLASQNIVLALSEYAETPRMQMDALHDTAKKAEQLMHLLRQTIEQAQKSDWYIQSEEKADTAMSQRQIDSIVVSQFKAELEGLTDADLERERREIEDRLDEDTPWLEALCAEQRNRANATISTKSVNQ